MDSSFVGPKAHIMCLALIKYHSGVTCLINSLKEHVRETQTLLALLLVYWDMDLVLSF